MDAESATPLTTEQLKDLLAMGEAGYSGAWDHLEEMAPTLAAEVVMLREALESINSLAALHQEFYDRNGPQWTSPQGNEYEDTSAHLDSMNALAEIARQALNATSEK